MRDTNSAMESLEKEINKAFDSFSNRLSISISEFLRELDVTSLVSHIFRNYSEPWRYRHNPKAMIKATFFMKLKGFKFQTQLIKHLNENIGDAWNLGCDVGRREKTRIVSRRAFNHFMNERITKDVWELINFASNCIKKKAVERGKLFDLPSVEKEKKCSDRTHFRKKQAKTIELCKLMRKTIYPQIRLEIAQNSVYKKKDFLDLITHVALTHDFAENGSATMKLERDKTPDADTLLYHIKKYGHRKEVEGMFERIFDMTFEMARKSGFLKRPVDLAIDCTDIMYYGDREDYMVVGTKPGKGTNYAFRFATVNIVENGERYVLFALPVAVKTRKVDIVERLLRYANGKVRIKTLFMDRGFFSTDVIEYLNRKGIKFIMPATKNWRIKRLMEKVETPYVSDYKMKNLWMKSTTWFKLIILTKDGNKYAFATNTEVTKMSAVLLPEKYSRRWGIETSYRVKECFRARTTSKNYIIRLFYFMFSITLYNLWVIVNAMLCMFLYGKNGEKPLVTAKIVGTLLIMADMP